MTMAQCPDEVDLDLRIETFMTLWAAETPAVAALRNVSEVEQLSGGYGHTLREIGQQPATWLDTAARALAVVDELTKLGEGRDVVVLTGSGSSHAGRNASEAKSRDPHDRLSLTKPRGR